MVFNLRIAFTIGVFFLVILLFEISLKRTKITLLKRAKNKKQISNIKIFTRTASIIFFLFIFMLVFFSYFQSWTGVGIFAGLLTAGLGFAL